ncbi:MAG TPA: hypothetical protein VFZ96_09445 [Actinomycetota bacterium]|nr:hypothetical protein [Actinomycetota bacterium]
MHVDARGLDGLMYLGDDARTERVIVETLLRLPEDVRAFALERCVFLSVGWAAPGLTLPGAVGVDPATRRSRDVWLIVLEEQAPLDLLASAAAHEIAHAWLRHDRLSEDLPDEHEVQAAELAQAWGFSGKPADPGYWQRRLDRERREHRDVRRPRLVALTDDEPATLTT